MNNKELAEINAFAEILFCNVLINATVPDHHSDEIISTLTAKLIKLCYEIKPIETIESLEDIVEKFKNNYEGR